ncbi:DUF4429 domain-containing protein [Saccharopolyspora phatthalungensis]|uniref:DUF4429 domain-containing protein n=1 Tax=Saccharopolyspora phatthalungensis TaxID=664693 RepID=A0A840QAT1_9PSEU|nr:DUF4429 domain-containing protein [Saccharopolyspora phatthalungensis]MBB5157057.1 hypothetical protein [Saccharopolyspora phatthalungensis]
MLDALDAALRGDYGWCGGFVIGAAGPEDAAVGRSAICGPVRAKAASGHSNVSDVVGIEIHPARLGFNGYVTVVTNGTVRQHTALGRQSADQSKDPMSVQIRRHHNEAALALRAGFEATR